MRSFIFAMLMLGCAIAETVAGFYHHTVGAAKFEVAFFCFAVSSLIMQTTALEEDEDEDEEGA